MCCLHGTCLPDGDNNEIHCQRRKRPRVIYDDDDDDDELQASSSVQGASLHLPLLFNFI